MSDIKPWQVVLIVVAVGVLAFSAFRMMGNDVVKGPSGIMTVDVMTGQLYMVKKGKARGVLYPVRHPDTGERTLFPVNQDEDTDEWTVTDRLQAAITDEMRNDSSVLKARGSIEVLDEDPIVIVIKK